jgi:predicted enzyme related to lactoylglutathione lyase
MDTRIQAISLIVKDKTEALKFYTEKAGFEKKTDYTAGNYRYVTVGLKGQDLELALWQVGSPDAVGGEERSRGYKPGSAPPIVLTVDDCRRLYAELKARGVQFKQELQEFPWGISATFSDPDGNLFSINQLHRMGS